MSDVLFVRKAKEMKCTNLLLSCTARFSGFIKWSAYIVSWRERDFVFPLDIYFAWEFYT